MFESREARDDFTLLGERVALQVRTLIWTQYARLAVKMKIQKLLYGEKLGYYDEFLINYYSGNHNENYKK